MRNLISLFLLIVMVGCKPSKNLKFSRTVKHDIISQRIIDLSKDDTLFSLQVDCNLGNVHIKSSNKVVCSIAVIEDTDSVSKLKYSINNSLQRTGQRVDTTFDLQNYSFNIALPTNFTPDSWVISDVYNLRKEKGTKYSIKDVDTTGEYIRTINDIISW